MLISAGIVNQFGWVCFRISEQNMFHKSTDNWLPVHAHPVRSSFMYSGFDFYIEFALTNVFYMQAWGKVSNELHHLC